MFVRTTSLLQLTAPRIADVDVTLAALDAMEQFGESGAFSTRVALSLLPHDAATLDRLLTLFESYEPSGDATTQAEREMDLTWFLQAPFELISPRHPRLAQILEKEAFAEAGPEVLDTINLWKDLSERSGESLRSMLEEMLEDCQHCEGFPAVEIEIIEQIATFLSPTDGISNEEIEAWCSHDLNDAIPDYESEWRLYTGIILARKRNISPRLDRALSWLTFDWDILNEQTVLYLSDCGDDLLFRGLIERYPTLPVSTRSYLANAFRRASSPELAPSLIEIFKGEDDTLLQVFLAEAVAASGTMEALAVAKTVFLEDPEDPTRIDLLQYLYTFQILREGETEETRTWKELLKKDNDIMRDLNRSLLLENDWENEEFAPDYDPDSPLLPDEWNQLSDLDKESTVSIYVRLCESEVENPTLHASIHVIIENQIAMGDEIPVAEVAHRLMKEGLSRHDTIHAIGSVLGEAMFSALKKGQEIDNEKYYADLGDLSAARWLADGFPESAMNSSPPFKETNLAPDGLPYQREAPKVRRNDPCPCGSGKKYKQCCLKFAN
ncbi:MAG: DUF1841 family protein [Verrucomicrobiales bacterium]|nr:DUF1841 family protein [Verrucomicrobiales bacterium]